MINFIKTFINKLVKGYIQFIKNVDNYNNPDLKLISTHKPYWKKKTINKIDTYSTKFNLQEDWGMGTKLESVVAFEIRLAEIFTWYTQSTIFKRFKKFQISFHAESVNSESPSTIDYSEIGTVMVLERNPLVLFEECFDRVIEWTEIEENYNRLPILTIYVKVTPFK